MKSAWVEREAQAAIDRYGRAGIPADLALRVYTTQLLGRDPKLVLHGGGNTSVKLRMPDLLGEETDVLCVKGSGWDMGTIEPAGLPAVRLSALLKLRAREAMPDDEMVRVQRASLIDPGAPNPSVETLLHAFIPHKFVDHTHASAVLSLIDQPDGEARSREVYGGRMGYVPYVLPGFGLAKLAASVFDKDAKVEGLILARHGIFTFGADAREAYERMIEMVTLAEDRLRKTRKPVFVSAQLPQQPLAPEDIAPIVRGACAVKDEKNEGAFTRFIAEFRSSEAILNFVNGRDVADYARRGVITPDHTIRTKNWPVVLPAADARDGDWRGKARAAVAAFVESYRAYFARQNARVGGGRVMLDPAPRVALVPGAGLYGLGRTQKDAKIAADLAEAAIETITNAEATGRFTPIGEDDMFDCEYWPLEQAKLGAAKPLPLAGQIAVVTGGAGAIGAATAKLFAAQGACVALLDIDGAAVTATAKTIPGALGLACDVTDASSVADAYAKVARAFGGVDILVSNAGAAWQGRIGEVDDALLRMSFELNFFAHQTMARHAVRIMRAQGAGGCLLFNVSKQAVNPGRDFGPYGLPKAATLLLVRQYALDYGADGIRANAVNADRIRSGLLTPQMIAARAKARGLDEEQYLRGNLLRREVSAEDVAQAFLFQALAHKTTAGVITVDGGNIAAALR